MRNSFPTLLILTVLGLSFVATSDPFSSISQANNPFFPFSQKNIDTIKHCVYGYEDHLKVSTFYYAGDAAAFNETIADLAKGQAGLETNRQRPSMLLVIYSRPGLVPDSLTEDQIRTDWAVRQRPAGTAIAQPDLFIEIYANSNIKFDELVIPKGVRVHSCGHSSEFSSEVIDFVQRHNQPEQEPKAIQL